MFTFVTGGLRSGKSEYALRRATELGPPPWLYVATQTDGDDELKARLARHRRDQDATWKLIEAPEKIGAALEPAVLAGHGAVVIDRFTLWLSKRLAGTPTKVDFDLLGEVETLADRLYRSTTSARRVSGQLTIEQLQPSKPTGKVRRRSAIGGVSA